MASCARRAPSQNWGMPLGTGSEAPAALAAATPAPPARPSSFAASVSSALSASTISSGASSSPLTTLALVANSGAYFLVYLASSASISRL